MKKYLIIASIYFYVNFLHLSCREFYLNKKEQVNSLDYYSEYYEDEVSDFRTTQFLLAIFSTHFDVITQTKRMNRDRKFIPEH